LLMGEGAALGTVHDCGLLSKKNYRLVSKSRRPTQRDKLWWAC
jgi:hypothetical protein